MTTDTVLVAIYEEAKLTLEAAVEKALIQLQDKTAEHAAIPDDGGYSHKLEEAIRAMYAGGCLHCGDGNLPYRVRELNGTYRWKHKVDGVARTCGSTELREIVLRVVGE